MKTASRSLLVFAVTVSISAAFTIAPLASPRNSALDLLPTQASELVAASQSAYPRKLDQDDDEPEILPAVTAADMPKARSFAQRVFSIPSSMIKRHPHPLSEGLPKEVMSTAPVPLEDDEEGVVLFPITGYRLVKDASDHSRALPTISNPSCRIPQRNEELHGWFRPTVHP